MDRNIGDVICDTHNGINLKRIGPKAKVVNHIQIEMWESASVVHNTLDFNSCVGRCYLNKHLILVGKSDTGLLQAMHSDDNHRLGIVEIAKEPDDVEPDAITAAREFIREVDSIGEYSTGTKKHGLAVCLNTRAGEHLRSVVEKYDQEHYPTPSKEA